MKSEYTPKKIKCWLKVSFAVVPSPHEEYMVAKKFALLTEPRNIN